MHAPSQANIVRQQLEDAIVQGRLAPGSKLDPDALAQEFGCSRTPVREALQQLSVSGLVTIRPKRGSFVTWLSIEEMAERFELMAEIEAICGKLAARRITTVEMERLRESHRNCARLAAAGDSNGYYAANSSFHHLIYQATHNSNIVSEARRLHAILQPYRRLQLQWSNRLARSYAEHDGIIEAIAQGDDVMAGTLLYQHVVIQGDRFHDLVSLIRRHSGA